MKDIVLILVILFFGACSAPVSELKETGKEVNTSIGEEVSLTPAQVTMAGIATGVVESKAINRMLKLKGVIEVPPQDNYVVTLPMGGYLRFMQLMPGEVVKKGMALARVEDQQYVQLQQDYLVGKSRLQFLQEDVKRQEELNQSQAVSNKVYQQTLSDYQSQLAIVKSLAEKLRLAGIAPEALTHQNMSRYVEVRAPINGTVSHVYVKPGQYVTPTDKLFEIVNTANKHLNLIVFENDISSLEVGQQLTCYTNNNPKQKHMATISLINRNLDEERATEIHGRFVNQSPVLVPGMFMNAEIELSNSLQPAVPDDAIVRWENQHFVFVVEKDNHYRMTPVVLSDNHDGFTGVQNSLVGKTVVTKNAYTLLMKLKNNAED